MVTVGTSCSDGTIRVIIKYLGWVNWYSLLDTSLKITNTAGRHWIILGGCWNGWVVRWSKYLYRRNLRVSIENNGSSNYKGTFSSLASFPADQILHSLVPKRAAKKQPKTGCIWFDGLIFIGGFFLSMPKYKGRMHKKKTSWKHGAIFSSHFGLKVLNKLNSPSVPGWQGGIDHLKGGLGDHGDQVFFFFFQGNKQWWNKWKKTTSFWYMKQHLWKHLMWITLGSQAVSWIKLSFLVKYMVIPWGVLMKGVLWLLHQNCTFFRHANFARKKHMLNNERHFPEAAWVAMGLRSSLGLWSKNQDLAELAIQPKEHNIAMVYMVWDCWSWIPKFLSFKHIVACASENIFGPVWPWSGVTSDPSHAIQHPGRQLDRNRRPWEKKRHREVLNNGMIWQWRTSISDWDFGQKEIENHRNISKLNFWVFSLLVAGCWSESLGAVAVRLSNRQPSPQGSCRPRRLSYRSPLTREFDWQKPSQSLRDVLHS